MGGSWEYPIDVDAIKIGETRSINTGQEKRMKMKTEVVDLESSGGSLSTQDAQAPRGLAENSDTSLPVPSDLTSDPELPSETQDTLVPGSQMEDGELQQPNTMEHPLGNQDAEAASTQAKYDRFKQLKATIMKQGQQEIEGIDIKIKELMKKKVDLRELMKDVSQRPRGGGNRIKKPKPGTTRARSSATAAESSQPSSRIPQEGDSSTTLQVRSPTPDSAPLPPRSQAQGLSIRHVLNMGRVGDVPVGSVSRATEQSKGSLSVVTESHPLIDNSTNLPQRTKTQSAGNGSTAVDSFDLIKSESPSLV